MSKTQKGRLAGNQRGQRKGTSRSYPQSVEEIKAGASGRWLQILVDAGMDPGVLNGRNQPCPRCDGTDRFAAFADFAQTGGVNCRHCHNEKNADGFATLMWWRGWSFPNAVEFVSEWLALHSAKTAPPDKRRIVAKYDYLGENGELLFQILRYKPKDFRQRRPDGKGGWTWSTKGVRVVPYRLRELLEADPARAIFVVEGEKDVDRLHSIGLLATCNSGGAGKWTDEHAEFLRGRKVVVLPDNDAAGRKHALNVVRSLRGVAKSVRGRNLPGVPAKGDVSDFLDAGGRKSELTRVRDDDSPSWRESDSQGPDDESLAPGSMRPVVVCMADVEPREVSWLWPGRIPLGRITLLVGRPGEGKSFLTTDAAARVTTRTPWPDGGDCPQGSVILISAEDDPADTIRPRLDAHYADVRRVHLLSAVRRVDGEGHYERLITLADVDAIEAALVKLPDCKLIVVDPIGSFLGGGTDANRDNEVRGVLAPIAALAERHGPAVLVVAHRRKSPGSIADDLALGSRAFTGIARAVWHLTRDNDNKARRLLLPGKNNLAREGNGLAFSIIGDPARISWERDPVDLTADEGLAAESEARERKPGPDAEAHDAASAWLRSALADGPRLAKELLDEWKNGQGGSKRTLDRAKQSLGVEAYRPEVPGPWWWRLPDKAANAPEHVQLGDLGSLAKTARNSRNSDSRISKVAKLPKPGTLAAKQRGRSAGDGRPTP